jgi:hypothetical protein
MNERIKELVEKSYIYDKQNDSSFFNKELFAESIILECVNAVMDGTKEGDHYAQKIEQHFDNSTDGIVHFGVTE